MKRVQADDVVPIGRDKLFAQRSPPALRDMAQARKARWSKETYISLLAALGILAHLITRYVLHASADRYALPLILVLLVGGAPLVFDLLKRATRWEFGSDLLAGLSISASVVLGEYLAGS